MYPVTLSSARYTGYRTRQKNSSPWPNREDKPELKPITNRYLYESDFFSTLQELGKLILPRSGSESPVLTRQGFLQPAEAEAFAVWQASGTGNADRSLFGESMSDGHIVLHNEHVLGLCDGLARRADDDLKNTFGVQIRRVVEAKAVTMPVGASGNLHTDHAVRQYDDDGWPVKWPSTTDRPMLTLLFFLSDSVDEVTGDHQCVGGNIEFPYIVDQGYETLLLEPRRLELVAFPDHPVYSYRIHEIYENQSRFVVAWAEVGE